MLLRSLVLPVKAIVMNALSRAEEEMYESMAEAIATNNAIAKRQNIREVCALRPGPLRDEEIELARRVFGDFSCP